MGFFKRLFAKKPGGGGTRVGNLLRQIAYNNSGGLLGKNFGQEYLDLLVNGVDGAQSQSDISYKR